MKPNGEVVCDEPLVILHGSQVNIYQVPRIFFVKSCFVVEGYTDDTFHTEYKIKW